MAGKEIRGFFCRTCGTMLFGESDARAGLAGVRAGTLDLGTEELAALVVKSEIFCASVPRWMLCPDVGQERCARGPDGERWQPSEKRMTFDSLAVGGSWGCGV